MILTRNGIALIKNGKALVKETELQTELVWRVRGTLFPHWTSPGTSQSTSSFFMTSTTPNTLTVDWGDGNVLSYDFVLSGGIYQLRFLRNLQSTPPTSGNLIYDKPLYYYQDLGVDTGTVNDLLPVYRDIKMRLSNPNTISGIRSNLISYFGSFPANTGNLSGLVDLAVQNARPAGSNAISYMPPSLIRTNIQTLTFSNIGTALNQRIPLWVTNSRLTTLNSVTWGDYSNVETSNLVNIVNLKNTLTNLNISNNLIVDLPNNFGELTNVSHLYINTNRFTSIPPVVNEMVNLRHLDFVGGTGSLSAITEWGDISNLVNLTGLTYGGQWNYINGGWFTPYLPSYISNFTLLKNVSCSGVFHQNQERCDIHVEEWYNVVTANASMSAGNTAFRQMTFVYNIESQPLYNRRPSGIYQQPSGYVQGSSNGTPASPMEMIWVMVNQYAHTWTVKPA